jgi:branched-subunit amino acid aminotransferase/4-amino-4-deoxychorismate lyase
MAYDVFLKNGKILPSSEATIALSNIEYAYGFGVYETIRVVRGKPLFLEQHLERLMSSAKCIGLTHTLDTTTIGAWTKALIAETKADALNLKMLLIGARDIADVQLYIIPLAPLFPDKRLFVRGASVISIQHERFMPQAKTLNMLPSYLSYSKAKAAGCYDAIYVNRSGCITEGTRTNFFALRGTQLISPPKNEILEGVTLLNVIKVAEQNGFTIAYEDIPLAHIHEYDGAFLTSTSSKIMPLSQIDGKPMPIPDSLHTLIKHFEMFLDEANERS